MKKILEFFPLKEPRPRQIKAFDFVEQAYADGYRDIVIEAPTGAGKSAIAAAIGLWAASLDIPGGFGRGAYALVNQKLLQDQLAKDLPNFDSAKGRAAQIKSAVEYICPTHKLCSQGGLKKCACRKGGTCPYKIAKDAFNSAELGVTNYAYYFTAREGSKMAPEPTFVDRSVLCCDEAHNLGRIIIRFVDVGVSGETLERWTPLLASDTDLTKLNTLDKFCAWVVEKYIPELHECAKDFAAISDGDVEQMQEAVAFEQHACKVARAIELIESNPSNWVFWQETCRKKNGSPDTQIIARPLDAAPFFKSMVEDGASLRVYLSAYLGPKSVFCRDLGLDPERVKWLRLGSDFPPENRPVHFLSIGSLSRANLEQTQPRALAMVDKIASIHAGERGLIHCHSYAFGAAIADKLCAGPNRSRVRFPKTADDRNGAIEEHAAADNSILISPSIGEGFDFKDELARWQIIYKCPFPSMGDKQVAAKAAEDSEWYDFETVKAILQMAGRICRSASDHGKTYVIDSDAAKLISRYQDRLPQWFLNSLHFQK